MRGDRYWTDFAVEGRRYRKPLRTSKRHEAKRLERDLIEAARNGGVPQDESGPKTLASASAAYLSARGFVVPDEPSSWKRSVSASSDAILVT